MIPFEKYSKTFNNVALIYEDQMVDYVIQLNYIIPTIREKYPDISISLFVREDLLIFANQATSLSNFNEDDFSFIRLFKTNPMGDHPVMDFIREANLAFQPRKIKSNGSVCLICPNSSYPSNSLTKNQKDIAIQLAVKNGCEPIVINENYSNEQKITLIEDAYWVIGSENEYLFLAGIHNKKATLIPTGQGTELFKMLFINVELLNASPSNIKIR